MKEKRIGGKSEGSGGGGEISGKSAVSKAKSATKPKLSTVEQISAGGVAFRRPGAGKTEVALIRVAAAAAAGETRWQLPKGLIDAGETPEEAARREVREEAGIETDLLEKIETIEYWYVGGYRGERVRFHKLVHFFLLEYKRGDVEDHDAEVQEAKWFAFDEAAELLTFKSERETLEKARARLEEF